jgi:putative aldouronate transport system substrate-binding protein
MLKLAAVLAACLVCLPAFAEEAYDSTGYLTKYDPPITFTAWRYMDPGIKFENGDDIQNNVFTKMYKDELGIDLKYVWTVPLEQYEQRLNIAIAAGDLPDLMWVTNKQLVDLAENDQLYDLTNLFKTKLTKTTQAIMQQDQGSFDTAKIGGKLMALPYTGSAVDSLQVLYVRSDWLKKLGLSVPKTMQDLQKVAKAFTDKDPDGNGKADTYGLAITKNAFKITENHAAATGFFAGYHSYVRRWIKDSKGSLVYGSIQPETKVALKALQDMYKAGQIDREFGVKDRNAVTEAIASGKVGITYGGMSSPGAFLKNNVLNDPKADWVAIPLVSIDSKVAAPIAKMPVTRYFAVNKDCKHPEALMKLIEKGTKGYTTAGTPEENAKYGVTPTGISVFQYAVVGYEPALKNLNAHKAVLKALEKKDPSGLNAEQLGYYEKTLKSLAGDRNFWGDAHIFGTPSSFDVIEKYVDGKSYIYNAFYGANTPTMVDKLATLDSMEDEVFTKIVMGQDISTFDKFVSDWKKLGGDQIVKEVNDWAKRQK